MDRVQRRRLKVFLIVTGVFVALAVTVTLIVPALREAWGEKFLRSPHGVPYSPEGAVDKTVDQLKGE